MQFESRIKRNYLLNIALSFIPEILISWLIAYVFETGVSGFFITLIGLQLLYILIWLKCSLWDWTLFSFKGRGETSEYFYNILKSNKYPEPEEFYGSAKDYLGHTVNEDKNPIETRLKCAETLGFLDAFAHAGLIQAAIRINMAFEDAIERYKKSFK